MAKASMTVLTIREAEIFAHQYNQDGHEIQTVEIPIEAGNIAEAFTRLKKELSFHHARVFLPEDKTFLITTHVDFNTENIREIINKQLTETVTEPIDNLIYDYQTVGKNSQGLVIQAIVTVKSYLHELEDAAATAGFDIEKTEPMSFALARETSDSPSPHLIVYVDSQVHLAVAHGGRVFTSLATYSYKYLVQQCHDLISFTQNHYNVEIKNLITNRNRPEIQQVAEALQLTISTHNFEPAQSLAQSGKEEKREDAMPFDLKNATDEEKAKKIKSAKISKRTYYPPHKPKKSYSGGVVTSALAFLIGAGLMFSGGVFVYDTFFDKPEQIPSVLSAQPTEKATVTQPTSLPTATPTLTPTPIPNRTELHVKVLNGNGGVGIAAKAKQLLLSKGYTSIETGNAGRYDYPKTEIQLKPSKAYYYQTIAQDLSGTYEVTQGTPLDTNNSVDVVIIIGEK
ncbi:LytR C-terminal domain-containing protein [candidate division WWE3 bacterium]|nr:LytR C-terminal domain-containing protein [candidate division WWE3 bacterium]